MRDQQEGPRDRSADQAQEVVGSEGGAAPWGGSSRVNKAQSGPRERSAAEKDEPVSKPGDRPQNT
jgi:hypothetical protein